MSTVTAVRVGALLMLVAGGIWAGVCVAYAVERTNQWARMPLEQYAVDFRRSLFRVDPMQPILLIVSVAGAVLFALKRSGTAATLAWVAVALLLGVLVASLTFAEPMNAQFRRRPEGDVPPEAAEIRVRWRRFHLGRTVVALAALVCLVLALTYT